MPDSAGDRPPDSLFIAGVHALDHGGSFTGPVDVSVVDGRIAEVRAGRGPSLRPARGQLRLDGQGLWLLPGIFDCHLHAGLASFDQLELMRTPISRRVLETAHTLRRTLEAGVTFVRDAGIADAGIRDAVAGRLVPGPELQVSVVALGATGGHGDGFLAGPGIDSPVDYMLPDYPGRPPYLADGPAEFRAAVRRLVRAGADWIKLLATGGVLSAADGEFAAELGEDEISSAVAEATSRGRPVMVHALGGPALRQAVEVGARSIEHGVFLTEADAALMAARGCFLVPTLVIYDQLAVMAGTGQLAGARADRARAVGARLGEAVAIARDAGVPIALGSDFGHRDDHGRNLAEIALLHRAGLSLEAALLAATAAGAELCGVSGRLGRIAAGEAGIRQFLDIGTGLPTAGNTHEIAQAVVPECRVVYVDNDPVVLVHARALLTSDPAGVTSYIDADARDPDTIVGQAGATLDFGEPVAIIMMDLLNFIDDEAVGSIVPRLTAAVAPGSYLAIMHPASDLDPALLEAEQRWNQLAAQPVRLRSREDMIRFLTGLELVEPGLVTVPQWRPEAGARRPAQLIPLYAAVARKP